MATITGFEKTWTISGYPSPLAFSLLDCGHKVPTQLVPARAKCMDCGAEQDYGLGHSQRCTCAGSSFSFTFMPDAHTEAHWVSKAGDAVECEECTRNADAVARLEALDLTGFMYARFRYSSYYLYRRDETSPTGVMCMASFPVIPAVEAIMQRRGISPLSPTERTR